MSTYQTKPKKILLEMFSENEDKRMTIDEIINALGDNSPGKSTVYRLVKKLEEDGTLRRFTRDGTNRAEYQLCGINCCADHLHIKCLYCGLLIHLDHKAQDELMKNTGFVIDDVRSMLYGKCAECAGRTK